MVPNKVCTRICLVTLSDLFTLWWVTVNLIDDGEIFGTGCCYKPAAGVLLQLFLPAVPVSWSCQLLLPAVPASLLLMVLQLLSLLQLSGHCSCSCLATAAAHSLLLVLQLFLPAAAAADGVAAALQLSGNCQLLLTGLGLLGSEQSTRVCLRRKIILGLRYIDVTVPLRNLPVLAGCVLFQPQLVLLCLLL